jgi:hypothetical protein
MVLVQGLGDEERQAGVIKKAIVVLAAFQLGLWHPISVV